MLRKIPCYKLLLFVLLIVGCARENKCDAGPPCEADGLEVTNKLGDILLGTVCDAIITVDWPDGEKDAEAECDEMYNIDCHLPENAPAILCSCTCKKATRMQY